MIYNKTKSDTKGINHIEEEKLETYIFNSEWSNDPQILKDSSYNVDVYQKPVRVNIFCGLSNVSLWNLEKLYGYAHTHGISGKNDK